MTKRNPDEIMLVGACTEFCPRSERIERAKNHQIDPLFEKDVVIKRYNRPAAGKAVENPEDVRSPQVLLDTVEHLMTETLKQADFPKCYPFIWDRLRAVRQDLTVQQSRCAATRRTLARCVRFYTISRVLCANDVPLSLFDRKVNDKHLVETLGKLIRIYEELDEEDEVRPQMESLYLLLNLENYHVLQRAFNLSPTIQSQMKPVLRLAKVAVSSNFYGVLRESNNLNILQWCIVRDYLNAVRIDVLRTLNTAFSSSACAFPLTLLSSWLYCGIENCRKLVESCGVALDENSNVNFLKTRPRLKFIADNIPALRDDTKKQDIIEELSAICL